jgi:hypothetical protein
VYIDDAQYNQHQHTQVNELVEHIKLPERHAQKPDRQTDNQKHQPLLDVELNERLVTRNNKRHHNQGPEVAENTHERILLLLGAEVAFTRFFHIAK